jgi:hypothetical protein
VTGSYSVWLWTNQYGTSGSFNIVHTVFGSNYKKNYNRTNFSICHYLTVFELSQRICMTCSDELCRHFQEHIQCRSIKHYVGVWVIVIHKLEVWIPAWWQTSDRALKCKDDLYTYIVPYACILEMFLKMMA